MTDQEKPGCRSIAPQGQFEAEILEEADKSELRRAKVFEHSSLSAANVDQNVWGISLKRSVSTLC